MTDDLHAPGTLLGLYWMLFGIGAVLGARAVGALRQLPLWPVTVGIVVGWGLSLLPFGFGVPAAVSVACFTLDGAIYGPFVALSVTLMQAKSATAAPGRDARGPQCGAAHRIAARHGARRDRSPRRWARERRSAARDSPPWRLASSRASCCRPSARNQ